MAADNAITLQLLFRDKNPIAALDLSSLIFDLNRIYVIAIRLLNVEYGSIREFRNFGRNSYRLPQDLRLDLGRIRFESPGLIELMTASAEGASAFWLMVQALDKLTSWPLNIKKLRLEVIKLEREIGTTSLRVPRERREPFLNMPEVRSATKQLETNPLKASEIEISPGSERIRD